MPHQRRERLFDFIGEYLRLGAHGRVCSGSGV